MDHQQQPAALSWASIPLGLPGAVARAALLGLTPSLMHRHPIQGSTHVSSAQKGTGNSPHISAKQRLLWSQAAEPGASSRHGTQGVAGCLQVHLAAWGMSPRRHPVCCHPPPQSQSIGGIWTRIRKRRPCWYLVLFQPLPPQTAVSGCSQRSPGELCSPSTEPRILPCPIYVPL